jgi:hypothetical protein
MESWEERKPGEIGEIDPIPSRSFIPHNGRPRILLRTKRYLILVFTP